LPFCKIELTAKKLLNPAYPKALNTLGDQIRKRRLDLKLMQKQAAEIIGTNETSLMTWERNQRVPSISFIPKIIKFLGYLPYNKTPNDLPPDVVPVAS
jgi:transcriptional regulator with XRE-family HTH domain